MGVLSVVYLCSAVARCSFQTATKGPMSSSPKKLTTKTKATPRSASGEDRTTKVNARSNGKSIRTKTTSTKVVKENTTPIVKTRHSQERAISRVKIPKALRFEVFKRDSFTCQYCGRKSPEVVLNADHIKPVSLGGTNDISNLVTSCADCNVGKGQILVDDLKPPKTRGKSTKKIKELSKTQEQILQRAAIHDKFLMMAGGESEVYTGEETPLVVGEFGTSRYIPEFCDLLLKWMGQGRSFDTFGVAIYRATKGQYLPRREYLYGWVDKHSEFAEAKLMAEVLHREWWESHGIDNLYYDKNADYQFNASLWYNNMRNKFKWGENVNLKQEGELKISVVTSIPRPALNSE